jgi:pimeloyl-ACP methyl ester carboxylesterase
MPCSGLQPTILVGHSYGGTLITHAGTDARVAALVYIAALAPDADETSQSLLGKFPASPVFDHLDHADADIGQYQCAVDHDRRKGGRHGAEYRSLTILDANDRGQRITIIRRD